jgi:hypothetical protein
MHSKESRMSRRPSARLLFTLALAGLVAAPLLGCGGGASGTPANADLIVTYFNVPNRTDVYRNQPLELRFSAPLDPASVNDRTIRVRTGADLATPVSGALIVDGNKVIFDPTRSQVQVDRLGPDAPEDQPFGYDALADYQVIVPGPPDLKTLKNLAGRPILSSWFATFSTSDSYLPELVQPKFVGVNDSGNLGYDPEPPAGAGIDPVDGQTEVPYDSQIIMVFSEPIAPESMDPTKSVLVENLDVREPNTPPTPFVPARVPGTLRSSSDGRTWTFVPSFSYGPGPYRMRVTMTQDITDLAGNPLEAPVKKYFRTESKPGVELILPIIESFSNTFYKDTTFFPFTASWNGTVQGALVSGDITTTTVKVKYIGDGVNSMRSEQTGFPIPYPFVSAQQITDPNTGNVQCSAWPNGCRFEVSYKQEDIGEAGAIAQVSWGPMSNRIFAATHESFQLRIGHTKDTQGVISSKFEDNFLGGYPQPNYDGIYDIPSRGDILPGDDGTNGFWPFPDLSAPFEYNGTNGLLLEFKFSPATVCQWPRYWFHGTGAGWPGYPGIRNIVANKLTADTDNFTGGGQPLVLDMQFVKKRRTTKGRSRFYDTNSAAPDYGTPILSPAVQSGGASVTLEWQGATNKNDPTTYGPWGSTIDIADNMEFIRFRVTMVANLKSGTLARIDEIRIPFATQ